MSLWFKNLREKERGEALICKGKRGACGNVPLFFKVIDLARAINFTLTLEVKKTDPLYF